MAHMATTDRNARRDGRKRLRLGSIAAILSTAMLALALQMAAAADVWKSAIATVFWVGEEASEDNGYIPNAGSAWDQNWLAHYGGVDDPNHRCGYEPCAFTPKENPFYVALPYDDMTEGGATKASAAIIPWFVKRGSKSILKNRWIAVRANDRTCYAQWQDVGPFVTDDAAYVFGTATEPKNRQIAGAGIDLSPAMRDCLQVEAVSRVSWRHVEDKDVPSGPWRKTVTRRPGP
jgi:hypothetical protein